jgi:acetylornithine deacetylase/succinyl-diaminopimelate desuccinylase-like protein
LPDGLGWLALRCLHYTGSDTKDVNDNFVFGIQILLPQPFDSWRRLYRENLSPESLVRYRGDDSGGKPILLMAHMDVVEALSEDWTTPPFELTEKNGYLYGRGTFDNKGGVAALSATFLRMKAEVYTPKRDYILVVTGDEETTDRQRDLRSSCVAG